MNKIIFMILIICLSVLNANTLINATDARKVTQKETNKLVTSIIESDNGKKAYDGLIEYFNRNIAKISSGGFYDSFVITYMSKANKISELLKPLSRKEQDVVRSLIIKELNDKGYSVKYNKFWDNPGSFNITVTW